ncbi:hypothetical protein CDV55_105263 [Aspergillus turcosus]|uniref:Uncharacterized protein n=1 Tax=Aspergillus turcosus TaxID=1245748 RepID=A0A229Z378_9EURO|nr:hypothetical protein CDV55_105263 [Aspergillus turcosus]RLM01456.1 hypothetical protein CFD26_108866 [Aspergillus turcosus]
MLSALVFGIGSAIGHHLFYNSLDGKPTPNTTHQIGGLSYSVSSQQINIAAGTVFAFLVKFLLGSAVSTTLEQLTWKAIEARTTLIATVDDLLSLSTSVLTLINPKLWGTYPILTLLGAILWLLPVASVVTPATLTVHQRQTANSSPKRVPQVDFTSLNFPNLAWQDTPGFRYEGPANSVMKVVEATASGGEILSISAPASNSSWRLSFPGPSLSCISVSDPLRTAIIERVENVTSCDQVYGFISWAPDPTMNEYGEMVLEMVLPFIKSGNNSYRAQTTTLGATYWQGPLTLFMAAFPGMLRRSYDPLNCSQSLANGTELVQNATELVQNATVIQCSLQNSSYTVDFSYINGLQTVNISHTPFLNDVPYIDTVYGTHLSGWGSPETDPNVYNTTIIANLAYQAIMDAFAKLMVGSISSVRNNYGGNAGTFAAPGAWSFALDVSGTSILSTPLSETAELGFLTQYVHDVPSDQQPSSYWNGLSVVEPSNSTLPLLDAIQQLFQNITISLMSSALLQPNYSSIYAPPDTNVTITTWGNVYSYSLPTLWIAYGIAILVTTISVLLGLVAYFANHGSYSTKFSTIVRKTRKAPISPPFDVDDDNGRDPLPKSIARSKISIGDQKEFETRGSLLGNE